ncbi:MAG: DNA repair protein RadA [Clostridia bacterium]|nr:DNA repair protein RadA [Clostridia bacterium]
MKNKTVYICSECGYQTARWLGKCPDCGSWNTLEEAIAEPETAPGGAESYAPVTEARLLSQIGEQQNIRRLTGCAELDRVLGGGLVSGSAVLLCGEPGIGKSTLLLQICSALCKDGRVLYASGEESAEQLRLRADRLGVTSGDIYIAADTNIDSVVAHSEKLGPSVLIVDSIQTMWKSGISSSAGGVSQIKECASRLIRHAKERGVSVIIVGHVNKEGSIAGPKLLEHMVDTVLYFEGDRRQSFRLIRAIKNRFGATDEVGVFEMCGDGLKEVKSPSELLLAGRPTGVSGNCAVCTMEGTRPIITEVQALVTPSYYPSPKRASQGVDINRVNLILALLEKRLGLKFSAHDCYVNVIGGMTLDEPAADLGLALALISSLRDIALPDDTVAIGELGLSGEIRAAADLDRRLKETARLGFGRALVPRRNYGKSAGKAPEGAVLLGSIFDAIRIFGK